MRAKAEMSLSASVSANISCFVSPSDCSSAIIVLSICLSSAVFFRFFTSSSALASNPRLMISVTVALLIFVAAFISSLRIIGFSERIIGIRSKVGDIWDQIKFVFLVALLKI